MARPRKEFNFDGEINRETVKNYFESQNERLGKYRGKRNSFVNFSDRLRLLCFFFLKSLNLIIPL